MMIKNRYQAFFSHLLVSMLVGVACAAMVFLVWYPGATANASGVKFVFLTLLGVDVVIGPVITLIVFNRKKKELRRDLFVVLVLQLVALTYGLNAVISARPAYLVFSQDRFDLVYANTITEDRLKKAPDEFNKLPLFGPMIIATKRPEDPLVRQKLLFDSLSNGVDIQLLPEFYVSYETQRRAALERLQDLAKLSEFNKGSEQRVRDLIARHAHLEGGVGYLPVRGKVEDLTAVLSKSSGKILELVSLNPWP